MFTIKTAFKAVHSQTDMIKRLTKFGKVST